MQHLLGRAKRDADQVRDDVRAYVVEHLRDDQAVLVVGETGDVKKGTDTVGVQRQYTGTAGRIENAQVAVHLVYAGRRGHAAVDRELYVPSSWTSDLGPRTPAAAGPPDSVTRPNSRRNRSLPPAWSPDSWTPATGPPDSRETRSTAATRRCAPRWKNAAPATSSRWPARTKSPRAPGSSARTRWPGRRPRGPGRSCPQGAEPRATASTTGPPSTSPTPGPGAGSCRSAATAAPANSLTTAATRRPPHLQRSEAITLGLRPDIACSNRGVGSVRLSGKPRRLRKGANMCKKYEPGDHANR
ncbi:transposase [Streptomyces sp. NPDC057705]